MYPDKKVYAIIAGMVISSLICESLNKDHGAIPREHIHPDYGHLAYTSTTFSIGTIASTTASAGTIRIFSGN